MRLPGVCLDCGTGIRPQNARCWACYCTRRTLNALPPYERRGAPSKTVRLAPHLAQWINWSPCGSWANGRDHKEVWDRIKTEAAITP